jgi:hypothetical protein
VRNRLQALPQREKTCGESEFDIFEAKKRFPDSEKACLLKRKIEKFTKIEKFVKN